jgi:hypothetical protein
VYVRVSIVAVVVVASCHKDAAAPPQPKPGSPLPVATASDAQATPDTLTLVELLHATPRTIRVSSRVANAKISPADIADRDPSTAWNSRTGDPWPFRRHSRSTLTEHRSIAGSV